jgi:thioredoxin 1
MRSLSYGIILLLAIYVLSAHSFRVPTSLLSCSSRKVSTLKSKNAPHRRTISVSSLTSILGGGGGSRSLVKTASNMNEFSAILNSAGDKLVAIDFSASWCGPCQMIAPQYNELSKSPAYSNVVFVKVDVDEASDVASNYGVRSMPTFVFVRNSKVISQFSGASIERLKSTLDQLK